jgi:hypothetical protein
MRRTGRTRSRAAVPAVLLLVAGLFAGAVAASPSGAAPPSGGVQTTLELSSPTTANTADLAGAPTGAIPGVLAQKKVTPILTTLTVSDDSELSKGTVVNLTAVKVNTSTGEVTAASGTFTPASFTVPTKGASFPISVTYSAADTDVVIKATLKKSNSSSPGPGYSTPFDVVDALKFAPQGDPTLGTGFGAAECTSKAQAQVCGVVLLPNGIASAAAALSSGVCADSGCTGAEEVQFIAGLDGLYSKTAPATLLLRCDKSKCGGKGVSDYTAKIALTSSGALTDSPPCPSKGVLGDGHFCTDYVSSNRDNAGDLVLKVLFDIDMRGTM